jgi:hypothetical protein
MNIIHFFSKKTYDQAYTIYALYLTLILMESHASDVGPLTMHFTQIE